MQTFKIMLKVLKCVNMLIICIRKIEYEWNICYENKSLCDLHRQKEKYKELCFKY